MAKFNINSKPKASLKNKNTIKFNMFEGALTGNIFDVVLKIYYGFISVVIYLF